MTENHFIDQFDGIFFDLDGTLLGLSDDAFEGVYLKLISERFKDHVDKEEFLKALWSGTEDMLKHSDPNQHVLESFFSTFTSITGLDRELTYEQFDLFYRNEFNQLKEVCDPVPEARDLIDKLKSMGKKVVLATNPVFPEVATRSRCEWTNLDFDEFDYVSHAENSYFCKPNPKYYLRLCEISDLQPERVLMVGNDYLFDMAASEVGMKTWLTEKYTGNNQYSEKFRIDYKGSLEVLLDKL